MNLCLPKNYEYRFISNKNSDVLFISETIGSKFQSSVLKNVSLLSIKDKGKTFLLYNVGSLCQKIADFVLQSHIKKIILFGSNKVAYATIIWSYLLSRFLHKHNINIGFVAINPTINPDITHLSQKEVSGIKNYLNFGEFLNNYQDYPIQGFIYLPINKKDKYFTNNPNIRVFHTNYSEQDINYFINKSVSCSADYLNIVRKQYLTTGRDNWREYADRYLENNIPTLQSILQCLTQNISQTNSFLRKGNFDTPTHSKTRIIIAVAQISQIINATYWVEQYKKLDSILIVVEYTKANLNTPQTIFDYYLSIRQNNENIKLLFLEIPLSNKVNFNSFQFFEKKYTRILEKIKNDTVVINSIINRSAILGWVAKSRAKVYLIEEGLGTYLQISQVTKLRKIKYNPIFYNNIDYMEHSLIWNFGTEVMKKSLMGFLEFDKYYLTFLEVFNQKNSAIYYHFYPIKEYVTRNIRNNEIQQEIISTVQEITSDNNFILYIDQNFGIDINLFYQKIIHQLIEIYPKEKIFFIIHPKNQHNKNNIRHMLKQMNVENKIFLLDFSGRHKAELIIKILNPISICSLCSSTLVYCKALDYRGKIISISLPIIEEIKEIDSISARQNLIEATKSLKLVDCMVKGNQIEFVF